MSVGQLDAAIWIFRGLNAIEMSGRENLVLMKIVIRDYAGPERAIILTHTEKPYSVR